MLSAGVSSYATVEAGSMEIPSNQSFLPKAHRRFSSRLPGAMILPKTHGSARKSSIGSARRSDRDGWNILRDSDVLRPGDLISGFMKRIGLADHVIVVLSESWCSAINACARPSS